MNIDMPEFPCSMGKEPHCSKYMNIDGNGIKHCSKKHYNECGAIEVQNLGTHQRKVFGRKVA